MKKVLFFSIDWCKVCKAILPIFKLFPQYYKNKNKNIQFLIIDLGKRKELIKRFNIKEYPTFLIYENSKEIYRQENGDLNQLKRVLDIF